MNNPSKYLHDMIFRAFYFIIYEIVAEPLSQSSQILA